MRSHKGFTLPEIMIAICVCCLLGAVVYPAVALSRARLNCETCAGNERKIGLAILQYAQDNDSALPNRSEHISGPGWKKLISPYIESPRTFVCPENPYNSTQDAEQVFSISYAANTAGDGKRPFIDSDTGNQYIRLSAVLSPNRTIAVVETTSNATDFNVTAPDYFAQPNGGSGDYKGHLFAGHDGVSNFLFLDDHVQCLKPLQTLDYRDGGAGQINMWTNNNRSFSEMSNDPHIKIGDATGAAVLRFSQSTHDKSVN